MTPYDSYRIFQSRIIEQYESMIKSEGFIVIDGTSGIEEQQQLVRETISKLLPHKEEKDKSYKNLSNSQLGCREKKLC
jgi:dTMP kinase